MPSAVISISRSGTDEEYDELKNLLQEITDWLAAVKEEEAARAAARAATGIEKQPSAAEKRRQGQEMRQAAMVSLYRG